MKNFAAKSASGALVLAALMAAAPAQADTATATATANILEKIEVINVDSTPLAFGTIVVGDTGGDVSISTAGSRDCAASLVCTGTVSAAPFSISGTSGELVNISLDSSSISLSNGDDTMDVALDLSDSTMTLGEDNTFSVGGTLTVADNQPDGAYEGEFTVEVDYP